MDDRAAAAWLARRVGFGHAPGELDDWAVLDAARAIDRWIEPDPDGRSPDPWAGVDLPFRRGTVEQRKQQNRQVISVWVRELALTSRPFDEWMRWFWHGHFVSTLRVVGSPAFMAQQLRMFGELGLGDFRTLLKAVTLDAAMLVYLNGNTNAAGAINENYGREVLELFALGVGNYTERDVRAGATALTGWVVAKFDGQPRFDHRLHDDTPQRYLGRTGVHDVDSVVDAIVAHPACAPFVAGKLARAILGPDVDPGLVTRLGREFAASGLQIRPLVRSILEAGIDGASRPLVLAPVPWAIQMVRATGVPYDEVAPSVLHMLKAAGQVPMDAPNVGGWPGGANWLTSSVTLARFDLAGQLAARAPRRGSGAVAAVAAIDGDDDRLADALGRADGFTESTRSALGALPQGEPSSRERPGESRLTIAIASPELALA